MTPLLLALTLTAAEPPAGLYQPETGSYAPQVVETIVLHDADRDKDLPVRVTWPDGDGPFPLIVWSHGAMGSKDNYLPLVGYWVSHGYVVLQATHSDSLSLGVKPRAEVFRDWASRPKDVSFMLDELDELEQRVDGLRGKIDRDRIGVGGHSFGAHTAQLIGGVTTRGFGRRRQSFRDERVKAVLLISPQGRGDLLDDHSWDTLALPAMEITGSNDSGGRTGESAEWRLDPWHLCPPGDKYLLFIEGAYHGFGGIAGKVRFSGSGPDNEDQVSWVRSSGLAFWDAYLKPAEEARAWLASDAISAATQDEAKLSRK